MDKLTEAYYQVITEEMKIPDIIAGLPKDFVMDKMDQLKTREERVAAGQRSSYPEKPLSLPFGFSTSTQSGP